MELTIPASRCRTVLRLSTWKQVHFQHRKGVMMLLCHFRRCHWHKVQILDSMSQIWLHVLRQVISLGKRKASGQWYLMWRPAPWLCSRLQINHNPIRACKGTKKGIPCLFCTPRAHEGWSPGHVGGSSCAVGHSAQGEGPGSQRCISCSATCLGNLGRML